MSWMGVAEAMKIDGDAGAIESDLLPLDATGVREVGPPDGDGVPVGDEQPKAEDEDVRVQVPGVPGACGSYV